MAFRNRHWWWSRAWDGDGGWGRVRIGRAGVVGAGLTVFRGRNTPLGSQLSKFILSESVITVAK